MRDHCDNLVVSHDAGAAEILCAWLQTTGEKADVIAEGPAARIFTREAIPSINPHDLNITHYQRLITGTSYGARLENEFIESARKHGVKSIAVLDHWLHYPERFQNCGYWTLPDELWACDVQAQSLARKLFPSTPVLLQPNWYWEKIRSQVTTGQPGHWLLALENRQPHGQTWKNSIDAVLDWIDSSANIKHLIVRPHPTMEASSIQDYLAGLGGRNFRCGISTASLVEDLSVCEAVIGYQTTVLALAKVCGKRSVSLVGGGEQLVIPLVGIELPFTVNLRRLF
jgi:hypothetical protein